MSTILGGAGDNVRKTYNDMRRYIDVCTIVQWFLNCGPWPRGDPPGMALEIKEGGRARQKYLLR